MRGRPDVQVRLPKRITLGDQIRVEVTLTSASHTPIDFVALALALFETSAANTNQPWERQLLRKGLRVAGEGELSPGKKRYEAAFALPADAPPSYDGVSLKYRYELTVHVAIPWWLDAREKFDISVAPAPVTRSAPAPVATSSALGKGPFIELSLGSRAFAPRDVITGSLAFGGLGGGAPLSLALALVAYERRLLPRVEVTEAIRFRVAKAVSAADEGREMPFRMAVPSNAFPTFQTPSTSLFWVFEARLQVRGAAEVVHAIPIGIAPFTTPAINEASPRRVGKGRWHAVWVEAGKKHGFAADERDLVLHSASSGCAVTVRTGMVDDKPGLEAEIRYPSLGINLSVGPRSFFSRTMDIAPQLDDVRLWGREEAQVRAMMVHELVRAMVDVDTIEMDDERAIARSATPSHDQPWIGGFLDKVAALARGIQAGSSAIPPPAKVAHYAPSWQRFAEVTGGRFCAGAMSVFGARIDTETVDVLTTFDDEGTPKTTLIALAGSGEEAAHQGAESLDDEALPPLAKPIVHELKKKAHEIQLGTGGKVLVTLPSAVEDPGALRDTIDGMMRLAALLRGDRKLGPYR